MGFTCGIVGLPNVGKSTLFNALTQTIAAEAANYPFCTIEPNVGRVAVPDDRVEKLASIAGSQKLLPTQLEFADIAGLVRGASKGEGLGNQFLAKIREVDAIVHVLRCFEDSNITHVEGRIDPVSDSETVNTELLLADLESIERRADAASKKAQSGDKDARALHDVLQKVLAALNEGKAARTVNIAKEQRKIYSGLQLLTAKPVLYVCSVEESAAAEGNDQSARVAEMAKAEGALSVVISASIEAEVAQLDDDERVEFLAELGLSETGLARIIHAGYDLLDLLTFFTVGPKETRAWTVRRGAKAPESAGVIHTDFEHGFIRAETIAFDDFINCNGEQGAKDTGKMRAEGKEYIVADGDVMHFRFNV